MTRRNPSVTSINSLFKGTTNINLNRVSFNTGAQTLKGEKNKWPGARGMSFRDEKGQTARISQPRPVHRPMLKTSPTNKTSETSDFAMSRGSKLNGNFKIKRPTVKAKTKLDISIEPKAEARQNLFIAKKIGPLHLNGSSINGNKILRGTIHPSLVVANSSSTVGIVESSEPSNTIDQECRKTNY